MILNIVNKSPSISQALEHCLSQLAEGDALLLIEDGVLAALDTPANRNWLNRRPDGLPVHALAEDLDARGLRDMLLPGVQVVDYAGFVNLTVQYPLSQSWY